MAKKKDWEEEDDERDAPDDEDADDDADDEDEDADDEEDEDADDEEDEEDEEDADDEEDEDADDEEDEDEDEDDEEYEDAADDHGHGHDEAEEEEESPAQRDPMWWTPHLVLGVLLVVGLLGFFGLFNKYLGFLAATKGHDHPAASASVATSSAATPPAAAPKPSTSARKLNIGPATPSASASGVAAQRYRAKMILVQWKGAEKAVAKVTRTKDQAKLRATEALAKAKKTVTSQSRNEEWTALVKEYSDVEGAAEKGGDIGVVSPTGVPHIEVIKALEKMKVGDVSDVVETPLGYHILWRTM
jgi:parvulin-like peptidyl-prolyl isomerase